MTKARLSPPVKLRRSRRIAQQSRWFWHYRYRNYLRDVPHRVRQEVKKELLAHGLPLCAVSGAHGKIIMRIATPHLPK